MARHSNNDRMQMINLSRHTKAEKLLYVLIIIEVIDLIVSFVR
jgi:cell division protein FtsL